jgi:hypothetical protein
MQLGVGHVADQVRPHPAVGRPAWWVDQHGHGGEGRAGDREQRAGRARPATWIDSARGRR